MPNLLFEVGVEEIPASYLDPAIRQIEDVLEKGFKDAGLGYGPIQTTATHRRLVAFVEGLADRQKSRVEDVSGPAAKVAFDESGKPTKAAMGFARGQGIAVEDIVVRETPKGKYCFAVKKVEGKKAMELLPSILTSAITSIGFPKSMHWLDPNFHFARPIRSVLALLGSKVVPLEVNGVKSGRITHGHPFEAPQPIKIESADLDLYKRVLRQAKVIVDTAERRVMIEKALADYLRPHGSSLAEIELLEEVTYLIEYPLVAEGSFAEEFLSVPACVLEAAMMEHQRYFPVRDAQGRLLPKFLTVANRSRGDMDLIRKGNERVLQARLADARFFWEEDKKRRLEDRVVQLKGVYFQRGLGTYFDKTCRIESLAEEIARAAGLSSQEVTAARRAAHLAKADLVTQMVGEFPPLQGRMGGEYARVDGEPPLVYTAISEHYMPRTGASALPSTRVGAVVSLADKLDNAAGCFALDLAPTGSQDPFALRRQTQAILRMIQANGFHVSLESIFKSALAGLPDNVDKTQKTLDALRGFFRDRLYQMCLDAGHRYDIVNAVLAAGFDDVTEFFRRLAVVSGLSKTDKWGGLVEVVERTFNIGKKADARGEVAEALLREPEEKTLWSLYCAHADEIAGLAASKDYERASLRYYEVFAQPVHVFFEKVYVNVDDAAVRNNRLLMLRKINELYSREIADLSQIVVERK
jgi:glycyl-tRNA synthetase beta chain